MFFNSATFVTWLVASATSAIMSAPVWNHGAAAADRACDAVHSSAGSVVEIARMSVPRAAHTATTLADGRVLVAGGFTSKDRAAQSAELFDPNTQRFSALPAMITVRHSHTATVLQNGKVLIVGGYESGAEVTSSAEIFDPAKKDFEATGKLQSSRAGHVAVLLENGKVLIAGGVGSGWTFLSSAELYDPATGKFSSTGDMTIARESHAAVRLRDGRVLIVGGHRDRREHIKLYTSAEVYDVKSGAFVKVGDMHVRRHKHDAVLLPDGRVLVSGGSDERDDKGAYNSTELFDPAVNSFAVGPSMQRARYKHNGSAVVLPNGKIFIGGGAGEAETYDPKSRAFDVPNSNSKMAGQFSAVAVAGGGALITGGYGGGTGPRATAWLYRP